MIEVKVKQNPLFQMNLLLWMTRPGRDEWINPYFYKNGFKLLVIEPETTLPPRVINFLNKNDFEFLHNARPEFILVNTDINRFIIVECKNQGFDITDKSSRETKQGVSFLCYTGKMISEDFGLEENDYNTVLNYNIIKNNYIQDFAEGLIDLQEDIIDKGFEESNSPGVSYFKKEKDSFYMIFFSFENDDIWEHFNFNKKVKVMKDLQEAITPTLYLIPIDSSGQMDKYGYIIFHKRIKNRLGSFFGQNLWKEDQNILDLERDILAKVIPVWDMWNNPDTKRHVRRQADGYIKDILNILVRSINGFDYEKITDGYKFTDINRELLLEIRKEFLKVKIKRESEKIKKQQISFEFPD